MHLFFKDQTKETTKREREQIRHVSLKQNQIKRMKMFVQLYSN